MPHPVVRLFDTPEQQDDAPYAMGKTHPDALPRSVDAITAEIHAAAAAGQQWVVFEGEPMAHPKIEDLMWEVDGLGIRARVTSSSPELARRGLLERLRNAGLAQLVLTFYGLQPTHDALVGAPGGFDGLVEALDIASRLNSLRVTVQIVLLKENHTELGELVARVREPADRLELVRLSALTANRDQLVAHGVRRVDALAAVQDAWEAARVTHLRMSTTAFATWPEIPLPGAGAPQPVDITLLELLRQNVPVPSILNGTWATPSDGDVSGLFHAVEEARSLQELGLQMAAYGAPPLDLPPAMGGRGLDRPPGAADADVLPMVRVDGVPKLLANTFEGIDQRPLPAWTGVGRGASVHVVDGFVSDNVLALSTLPGLADCLREHGAQVRLHSVWHAPFNAYDKGGTASTYALEPSTDPARPGVRFSDDDVEAFANSPARFAHARKSAVGFTQALDLSGADLVVVPGFDNALNVLDNPTLPPSARVVIPDFHLMTGLGAWHKRWLPSGRRSMDGGWWPDERIEVQALYPRYVRAYWRAGVPLRQLAWRPYPIHTGHFPPGPAVTSCRTWFAGGGHQRDWPTLAQAVRRLPEGCSPCVVHTRDAVPAPLTTEGEVRLLHFYEAIANSRFVVLPLHPDPRKPAGISVISMALAAGRPVIASATLATIDHLRHGHNAILVPPNQPGALAAAIARLDQDDALLDRLAQGARASAAHLSVDAWARSLLDGAPAATSFSLQGDDHGPFHAWPA